MKKSASAPGGSAFTSQSGGATSNSITASLANVERHMLPIGVSPLVASRMRLDATLSPSMLDLRMNTRNLVNEMKYNGGKIVSHQFALMRPRRNTKWEKPKDIKEDKAMRKLQKKVTRQSLARKKTQDVALEESLAKLKAGEASKYIAPEDEDGPLQVELDDSSLAVEVARLMADPRIAQVWTMMQVQGEAVDGEEPKPAGLQRSRLARALEAVGHAEPDKKVVEESLSSIGGDGPLALDEFASLVAVFSRRRRGDLKEHFKRLDADQSGTIGIREFKHLMWDLGITVTAEALTEFLAEADNDNSGEVEFEEFEHACQLVHQRHGFSRHEVEEFESLFDRYDADGSNEMESDELASAMGWFGSATTLDQARAIIDQYDDDGNGCLAKPEFLMVMRQRLEDEISEMRDLFHEFDTDESGTMDADELLLLFLKCGYTIISEVIEDAMKVALPHLKKIEGAELVFEDLLKVFHIVRQREGFSEKELNELTDVYNRHDKGGKGELREFELARCFNWMGYPLSKHRRRELWCRVDVDKTESIELGEFLKLLRLLREEEVEAGQDILRKSEDGSHNCKISIPEHLLKEMLIKLGYGPAPAVIQQAMKQSGDSSGDGAMDVQGVLGILRFIREKQVAKLRQSAGICDQQAQKIRGKFHLRIEAGKMIGAAEFEKVMCDMFPVARHSKIEREKIKALVQQQTGGNGIKDLMEAFWIVRLYGDMRDEDKWQSEQNVAVEAGFTNWQVASFREAFVASESSSDGTLGEREIQAVFEDLMSLTITQFDAMHKQFATLGDRRDHIEFADFLQLMHIVLQCAARPP